jgi:hypothetical protein
MKLLSIFILLFTIIISCKPIKHYTHKNRALGYEIRGWAIERFFVQDEDMKDIVIHKLGYSKRLNNEIDRIIHAIKKENTIDELGFGIYYFAIIRNKDTLYFSRNYRNCKYKNLVINPHSDIINDSLVNPSYP